MYSVIFRAPNVPTVTVRTTNPDRVIAHAFAHDIRLGAFPRWVPFMGLPVVHVEVVLDDPRSGPYMLREGRYAK